MSYRKMKDPLILVTGVGYKKLERIFQGNKNAEIIEIDGIKHKINIGASTAKLLAKKGMKICMIARDDKVLSNIKEYICCETSCDKDNISYNALELLSNDSIKDFISSLGNEMPIWLVHSIGLGSQSYKIDGGNPYLPFKNITPDLVIKEFETPVKSLLLLMQNLEPIFRRQIETRIVVVTSMSGIRPYIYGYSHASAKAGIHHAVRSLSLELGYKYKSVFVTEILPGIVDTGLYDSENVIKSVQEIGKSFGFFGKKRYGANNFPLMPPSAVAEAILMALTSTAHILSINMVAHGQFPHMGG